MPRFAKRPWLLAGLIAALLCCGCKNSAPVLQGKVDQFQQQQVALAQQQQLLQQRANALDRDNQELSTLLAQSRQQTKVYEDQVAALRDQLRGVTSQLAQVRSEKQNTDKEVQTLTASLQRRGSVAISPNNSYLQTLPAINLPDVHVRRDGDVIRIELPGEQLFESGSARLKPGGASLITAVAAELFATYPKQIVGIEGHTDSDPIAAQYFRNNHELSVARATSVYDMLVNRSRYPSQQLFLVGHGANHPIASNATLEGKRRNRRVELVVYPEQRN